MSIHDKLVAIQSGLHVGKDQRNDFGGFDYRKAEDILKAVKPLLDGCTLIITDKIVNFGDRYYIESTATLSDGESAISTTGYAREAKTKTKMDEAQLTGGAASYAKKYALGNLFAIDNESDPDTKDNSSQGKPEPDVSREEEINACFTKDDLTSIWKSMSHDEHVKYEKAFIKRGAELEKEL